MSKKHIAIFAAACMGGHYAHAQQDSTAKPLDEVVVTANKFPQKQSTTGKVLTVIGREQLERNSGRSIAQVLNEQAGLIINGAQGPLGSTQTLYLRGAGAASTLVLVDGVPANDPSGVSAEFDINHFSIDQVERIEILKGAQSVLYGSDAVAGVINIITRKQVSTRPAGFNASAAGGSYGSFKGNAGISGKADIFTYNAQYTHLQSDGFSAATDPTGNSQHYDNDGFRQDAGTVNVTARVSKDWSLRLFGMYSRYRADLDAGSFTDDKQDTLISKNFQTGLASQYQFGKSSFQVNLNLDNTDRKLGSPSFTGRYKGKNLLAEAYTNLYLAEHLGLLAGVDFRGQKADITSVYGDLGADSMHSEQVSGYASLLLKSVEGFSAELGGRYTHHSQFGSAFTWSFNPSYLINKEVKVFANISSGFRAPSLYNIASEYGNKDLKPEKSMSYEGGVQYVNRSNTFNVRATGFIRSVTDIIIFAPVATPPYGQYANGNKQNDHGFELEATVRPANKWTITANYANVDGKITMKQAGKDTSVFNLYRRPKNALNGTIGFQGTEKLFASIGLRWVDKRQDQFFNMTTFTTETVTLASYYNLNAYISYQVKSFVKIFADFQNITDQKYYDVIGYNSRRFNFMTGISVHF